MNIIGLIENGFHCQTFSSEYVYQIDKSIFRNTCFSSNIVNNFGVEFVYKGLVDIQAVDFVVNWRWRHQPNLTFETFVSLE